MILGKTVIVTYSKRDRYRRIIGTILLNATSINQEMVKNGFAWWYRKYSRKETYGKLEAKAQQNNLGLWTKKKAIAPWNFRKEKFRNT